MFTCLVCRSLCIEATQLEAIDLAHRHGFASVEARADELARLSERELGELLEQMPGKALRFGLAGLPIDMRRDEPRFAEGMRQLPDLARILQRCGVTRLGMSLVPAHDELPYVDNFRQHVVRIGAVARVLADHGVRFGLEYCATPTLRRGKMFEFIHTLPQLRELIAAVAVPSVGIVLDSWHWWISGCPAGELATLQASEVVSVDLNDAPMGIAPEDLADRQRELPGATGVINLAEFVGSLHRMGYDGPVRAEPFEFPGWRASREQVCAASVDALGQAIRLPPVIPDPRVRWDPRSAG